MTTPPDAAVPTTRLRTRLGRWVLAGLAGLSFAVGAVGVVVPGLPTTIFWIVAALLAGRACPELQRRVYGHRRLGPLIRGVVEQRCLPARTKRRALVGMWAMLGVSAWVLVAAGGLWWAVGLALVGLGASGYIVWGLGTTPAGSEVRTV